mgnify:FL=1
MKEQINQYLDLGGGTLAEQKEQKELELDRLVDGRTERISKIEKEGTARRESKEKDVDKIKEQRDIDVANAKEFSSSERERFAREIKEIDDAIEVSISNKKEYFVPAIEADNKNQTAKILANNERIEVLREAIKAIRSERDVVLENKTFMDAILQRKEQLKQEIEDKEKEIDKNLA